MTVFDFSASAAPAQASPPAALADADVAVAPPHCPPPARNARNTRRCMPTPSSHCDDHIDRVIDFSPTTVSGKKRTRLREIRRGLIDHHTPSSPLFSGCAPSHRLSTACASPVGQSLHERAHVSSRLPATTSVCCPKNPSHAGVLFFYRFMTDFDFLRRRCLKKRRGLRRACTAPVPARSAVSTGWPRSHTASPSRTPAPPARTSSPLAR